MESHHHINTYYASINKVMTELGLRFLVEIICSLENMCYCETPDKESSRVDKCYKIDGGILETEQKRYASFRRVRGLGHTTVSELLMTIQEKVLFDTFPHFSK